jgi:two-component system, chemotaxis family, chemotaxis protein CheY
MARILIIDDEREILDLLWEVLREAGHDCFCAENGLIGFRALEQSQFDLVVMDLVMPEAEGIETIVKIRRTGSHIPILAISGAFLAVPGDLLDMAADLGADRILAKPFQIEEFKRVVEELLAGRPGTRRSNPAS